MYLSKIHKLEIAMDYIHKMASDEAENSSMNMTGFDEEGCKQSEKFEVSLRYAHEVLNKELMMLKRKPQL